MEVVSSVSSLLLSPHNKLHDKGELLAPCGVYYPFFVLISLGSEREEISFKVTQLPCSKANQI